MENTKETKETKEKNTMDLSGLAEAIPATVDTTIVSQWTTVAAHKRPLKRATAEAAANKIKTRPEDQPERSRPNGRARREVPQAQLKKTPHPATVAAAETQREPAAGAAAETQREPAAAAAAETQREPAPSTSKETATAETAKETPPLPPPANTQVKRRKPRGYRGRRIAAKAPTAPGKEQPGNGRSSDERASSKRARLNETQSPRGEAKRAKTDAKPKRTVSYADASQSHLRVAVITVPPRDLSQEKADQLREAIDDSILETVLSPPSPGTRAPSFRGRPFLMEGVLAMWCEDENALRWLERAVKTLASPIPDTTLTVIRQSEMKKRLKAGLLIHTRITDAATLNKVLCAQNPWYKVDSWQCYDMTVDDKPHEADSKEKVVHLILGIPEDQKKTILDRDRRVAHMSGSGYIRFFSSEEEVTARTRPAEKETSTPEPSTSAPPRGLSEVEKSSPLETEGGTDEEDNVLRSP